MNCCFRGGPWRDGFSGRGMDPGVISCVLSPVAPAHVLYFAMIKGGRGGSGFWHSLSPSPSLNLTFQQCDHFSQPRRLPCCSLRRQSPAAGCSRERRKATEQEKERGSERNKKEEDEEEKEEIYRR